ncbi:hypothetical protein Pcac1_g7503 [Phytophthora cactorum]|nr:hypothetical protein Pcac1_g7503 [Phytophthora cactorum]
MLARAALTATALLAFAQNPGAHGNIKEPKATFTNGAPIVQWVMIDNFWVIGIGGDQVGKFKTMAKEKGMGFNDVVLDMVKDKKWGYTIKVLLKTFSAEFDETIQSLHISVRLVVVAAS